MIATVEKHLDNVYCELGYNSQLVQHLRVSTRQKAQNTRSASRGNTGPGTRRAEIDLRGVRVARPAGRRNLGRFHLPRQQAVAASIAFRRTLVHGCIQFWGERNKTHTKEAQKTFRASTSACFANERPDRATIDAKKKKKTCATKTSRTPPRVHLRGENNSVFKGCLNKKDKAHTDCAKTPRSTRRQRNLTLNQRTPYPSVFKS